MAPFADLGSAIGEITYGKKGERIGKKYGKYVDAVAPFIAPLLMFKKGGKVPKTTLAQVHKGEYVLPASVKPTKAQKKKVNALNKK